LKWVKIWLLVAMIFYSVIDIIEGINEYYRIKQASDAADWILAV